RTPLFVRRSQGFIMMFLLLLSLSTLACGRRSNLTKTPVGKPCNISQINELEPLDGYHILPITRPNNETSEFTCTHYNTENLTYTLRSNRKRAFEELESFKCNRSSFSFKVKGETQLRTYEHDFAIFCAVPINRTCKNPFEPCNAKYCPEYTAGSDEETAKLKCGGTDDYWMMWNDIGDDKKSSKSTSDPVCKSIPGRNEGGFYATFDNSQDILINYGVVCHLSGGLDLGPAPYIIIGIAIGVPILCCSSILIGVAIGVCMKRRDPHQPPTQRVWKWKVGDGIYHCAQYFRHQSQQIRF
ncbi:hypothetical protein PENTCL1PPCAC_8860, partial [Pristionchus entomophagus]